MKKCVLVLAKVLKRTNKILFKILIFFDYHITNLIFKVDFKPNSDDIFIVSYEKSGTTWLQYILYQLVHKGSVKDFDHIYDVVPFIDIEKGNYKKLQKLKKPRIFKSHESYLNFYLKKFNCKMIYLIRDGKDVAVSQYNHQNKYSTDMTFNKYLEEMFFRKDSWFSHVHGYIKNKKKLNVIFVKYEDLKEDFISTVERIAKFCNIEFDDHFISEIHKKSSFKEMKKYQDKFDARLVKEEQRKVLFNRNSFIRKGEIGDWKNNFSLDQRKLYDQKFNSFFGTKKYDTLTE